LREIRARRIVARIQGGTVKSRWIVSLLSLCAIVATAKDVKVQTAWERTFPNAVLEIRQDNLGHILVAGSDTNGAFALLLNEKGRDVASALAPIPGLAGASADKSGRIFLIGNQYPSTTVHCGSWAPILTEPLWIQTNNIGYFYPIPGLSATARSVISDEVGGAFVFGEWQRGLFLMRFDREGSQVKYFFEPFSTPRGSVAALIQSPSGDAFFVGNGYSFRNRWITVAKWNARSNEFTVSGQNSPGVNGIAFANAAACDSQGNLVVAGAHADDYSARNVYGDGYCFTMKLDPTGTVLWHRRYGLCGSVALGVAVDKSDNVIMTGFSGTVKYSPAGQVLWESPEIGRFPYTDRFGTVLLVREILREDWVYETLITKLNADGGVLWKKQLYDGSSSGGRPAGLVLDDKGNIYFAANSYDGATIVKLVEHGGGNAFKEER
jgi:hypothetical protein